MNHKISICAKTILPLAILALLCGCHKEEQPPAVPSPQPAPKPAIVSAEKTSFDEVTAKLDKGGNLYVYLSTEQVLSGLSGKIASISNFVGSLPVVSGVKSETIAKVFDIAGAWLKDSGLEQISGVGMSSIAREPGFYYSKMVVHHYPGKSDGEIWTLMGKEAHPLKELDLLPEDTVLASFADVDVPLAWADLQKHLKLLAIPEVNDALEHWPEQFSKMTMLDFGQVLDSLGGNYGVILTLDAEKKITLPLPTATLEIPSPGLAIVMTVKSDVIFDRVDALCASNPLVTRVDKPDLKMRIVNIPLPLPVTLRPTIARSGDYLLIATTDTMIEDILAVKAGKKKGFKSTAEFARLSQGIPDQGNNFSVVADRFTKTMMQVQEQAFTNTGTMTAAQLESLQHAFNSGTNYGAFSVGANSADGWEGYANGSQSLQSAILPMMAAGAGLVAAIAIPNFERARLTSQKNACINNLRLIDSAKQQWALENKKGSKDTPTWDDLRPFLPTANGKMPVCPAGGVYKIGTVGEKPTCSVDGHELP